MKRIFAFGLIAVFGSSLHAQTTNVRGKVTNGAGQPVANAVVELVLQGSKDTSGTDGTFSITRPGVSIGSISAPLTENMRLDNGLLEFTVAKLSLVKVEVFDVKGNIKKKEFLPNTQPGVYHLNIAGLPHSNGILIIHASIGQFVETLHYFPSQKDVSGGNSQVTGASSVGARLAKIAAAVDTLKVTAAGYSSKKTGLDSYETTVDVTLETETMGAVPKVTAKNATTVPDSYNTAVANPGKMTTNVRYPVYYYSTSFSSALPPPVVPKLTTPVTKPLNIYTPPDYDKAKEYPLIVIMHGITDNPNTWLERSNPKINTMFDHLITSKTTKPFIAVFGSGTIDNSVNGYYAFGAELAKDLLPWIEANYSVSKDRGSRAMAGFSMGAMQAVSTGLCTNLKEFAWFAGLHGGGGTAADIAKYVEMQNPKMYPLYYFYLGTGTKDSNAGASAANGLTTIGPYITSANFSRQNNVTGGGGAHNYPTAQVSLYNFLQMAFSPTY
ncbi:MAG: alpha/beta hydrolase-fold protein [Fibrobacteria bacterium]